MAYDPTKDDTQTGVTPGDYGTTGNNANARLRKINLNVDIATQAELNEVFNTLSAAISNTGTEWKEADAVLCSALSTEISNEVARATGAEEAIVASLSVYALSTTVADAYAVSVLAAQEGDHDNYYYTVKQGDKTVGTIDVAKDQFVSAAHFDGTILVLDLRNGDEISTDLSGLVDVYNGSEDSEVKVTTDGNVVSVELKDTIARVGTDADLSTAETIWGVKAYVDEKVADKNVDAEGDAIVEASAEDNKVTVKASDALSDVVAKVQAASADWDAAEQNAKDYADALSAAVSATANAEIADALTSAKDYTDAVSAALSTTAAADIATIKSEVIGTAEDLSSADTVNGAKAFAKDYADYISSSVAVEAEGDAIVSASANGKKVTVGATEKLSTDIARLEASADAWDQVSAKIDTSKVVAAANELSVLSLSALTDYQDIDMIITEVEKIKGALVNFTTALEA